MKVRLSLGTFVRHVGNKWLMINPRTGTETLIQDAEAFSPCFSRMWQDTETVAQYIARQCGVPIECVKNDLDMMIGSLCDCDLLECDGARQYMNQDGDVSQSKNETEHHSSNALAEFYRTASSPMELHIDLTSACNERCIHCYHPDHTSRHLDYSLLRKIIAEFCEGQGLTIYYSGGECTLYPKFVEACHLCRDSNLNIIICSNLLSLSEETLNCLQEVNPQIINVSLYSMNPHEHDSITSVSGSWKRTMDGILRCREAGLTCRIAMPILKNNYKSIQSVKDFAESNGMKYIPSLEIFARSNHTYDNLSCVCDESELREIFDVHSDLFGGESLDVMPDAEEKVCDVGEAKMGVNWDGKYYPCDSMQGYEIGNAHCQSVGEVWRGMELEYLRSLKNKDFPKCIACENRAVCRVCMAENFNATGSLFTCSSVQCRRAKILKFIAERE